MSTSSTRICRTVLRFTVLLCFWLQTRHNVFAANVTVLDTDPSIVYSPLESWSSSSNLCSTCINLNGSMTYHEGINSALSPGPTIDSTGSTSIPTAPPPAQTSSPNLVLTSKGGLPPPVSPSPSSPSAPPPAPTAPPPAPIAPPPAPTVPPPAPTVPPSAPIAPPPAPTSSPNGGPPPTVPSSSPGSSPQGGGSGGGGDGGSGGGGSGGGGDSSGGSGGGSGGSGKNDIYLTRQLLPNDSPVTLSYNFTGTAIYLFTILPPSESRLGNTPTNTNLSFTLDNQPAGNFFSGTELDYQPNTNVLSLDGLSNQPHQLVVTVGENSIFIFHSLIYTNSSSAQPPKSDKKNNIATFAGALGGSVGVLSLFSLGIAISIIRRRMLAARRDRLDSEANVTSDTVSMSGPMPFIPRFFPETIIPPDPPNYNDALSTTNHNNTPLLASLVSSVYSSRQRSYADIPPTSPPPLLEELPPPPFPVALSAPVLDLPASAARDDTIPSISTANQTDLGSDSSSNTSVTLPHEDTPLLHSSDLNTRPRSRASTPSLEPSENSETDFAQEDAS